MILSKLYLILNIYLQLINLRSINKLLSFQILLIVKLIISLIITSFHLSVLSSLITFL